MKSLYETGKKPQIFFHSVKTRTFMNFEDGKKHTFSKHDWAAESLKQVWV